MAIAIMESEELLRKEDEERLRNAQLRSQAQGQARITAEEQLNIDRARATEEATSEEGRQLRAQQAKAQRQREKLRQERDTYLRTHHNDQQPHQQRINELVQQGMQPAKAHVEVTETARGGGCQQQ